MRAILHAFAVIPVLACAVISIAVSPGFAADSESKPSIEWETFGPEVFERAEREDRYIILNMAAIWCHWCHVMERTTYADPKVLAKIEEKFIPVRVDQDSRPDLSYRYEDWGWPATIMFDSEGNEILKRRGYVDPEVFLKLLEIVIEDPSALPDNRFKPTFDPNVAQLSEEGRELLNVVFLALSDPVNGGFGSVHRFVRGDAMEYALWKARQPSGSSYRALVRKTLTGAQQIIDPVWGGMYQYSDKIDWSSPHYEKIGNIQLDAIKAYTLSYAQYGDENDLTAARNVARWLLEQMRDSDGGFFTSQDADVRVGVDSKAYFKLDEAARLALGTPPIDRNKYSRENGWAAVGLVALYDATGEADYLTAARKAVAWAEKERRRTDGLFGHGSTSEDNIYLADNLSMAEAYLALHRATGDRGLLDKTVELGKRIIEHFQHDGGGYIAAPPPDDARGDLLEPVKQLAENVSATRYFNLLHRYTADTAFEDAAAHGMGYLAGYGEVDVFFPGILLADAEIRREPVHVTVVGGKDDPEAAALFAAARRYPSRYLRIEWWDRREGPLPNPDVIYPEIDRAAAFACANKLCSLPVFAPEEVYAAAARVDR